MLPLALSAVLATCALAQDRPNIQPNAVRDQLMNQGSGSAPASGAPQAPAPAIPASPAPAKARAKTSAKPSAKAAAKSPAPAKDSATAAPANSANPPAEKPAEEKAAVRRDPFDTLLTKARAGNAPPENLPPGKAGLIVESLRIDGIVHSASGTIAIVSNAQQRVYFLREGDKLYDGSVDKIALDAISFNETGKDAFGKPLERVVTKRLYASSGEQQ
jgi:Tfp pilus assembly protein PilP